MRTLKMNHGFLGCVLFFLTLGSLKAEAGFMIEPYLGYSAGAIKYKYKNTPSTPGSYTDKTNLTGFGGRLGYRFMIPWVALDYAVFTGKTKADTAIVNAKDADANQSTLFLVVGADLPLGLRFWAGYGLAGSLTLKEPGTNTEFTGKAVKGGIGFSPIPFLSFNAEYIVNSFEEYKVNSGNTRNVSDSYETLEYNQLFVSVSVPF